ncbi:hypothetical protein Tco_0308231 [Tanacetum coccineum]
MMNYLKNQGTWKLSQLKNLSFEEVKEEFDKLVKQVESFAPINFEATKDSLKRFGEELQTKTSKRLKSDEAKDDKPTKKTRKRRKQMARKGLHTDLDKDDSEDSDEASEQDDSASAMLKDITRDDLTELYRIVMNRYGMNGPEDELEKVLCDNIPLSAEYDKAMLDMKLTRGNQMRMCKTDEMIGESKLGDWLVQEQTTLGKDFLNPLMADNLPKNCMVINSPYLWMVHQLTKFHVQRVDMVINPPWNLPFLGAKGLTSPEQTATEFNSKNSYAIIESFSPSPIPVEDSDSLIKEISLFLTPDELMPPGIENDDYDSKGDILFLEELLSNDSPLLHENESFYFDVPSSPRPPAKPPDDDEIEPDTGVLTARVVGDISEHYVLMPRLLPIFSFENEEKVHLLSHRGFKAFQLFSKSPMMIYGGNIPTLDVPFLHFYPP